MKLHDLGYENPQGILNDPPLEAPTNRNKPYITLSIFQLPELGGLLLGDIVDLHIKGTITEIRMPGEFESKNGDLFTLRLDKAAITDTEEGEDKGKGGASMPGVGIQTSAPGAFE
jgi:hypothetical protein